ncbi:MAG TPA: tetratricopeptide repeat protein [Prolixibacteraceae bacterium]|nr:tetratricopeptide repeat protein [Prolixibacteraceae bacterium]HPS12108.1 tetratricopeptide repeat protein [Prolixibacteraceae bacterium]
MRKIFISILFLFTAYCSLAQVVDPKQSKAQLASSYYRNNDFAKAAPLYLELFESSNIPYYFDNYISCLIGAKNFDEAEKAIKKQLRKDDSPSMQITLGYILKEKGEIEKSNSVYDKVIKELPGNSGVIVSVANNFFNRREYDYAEKTYLKGRELAPGEMFRSNLATIYAYTRNYPKMMDEYLLLLKEDEEQLPTVEGRLNSLIQYDFDNTLQTVAKKEVLRKTVEDPKTTVYNRLLIWMFIQEKNYSQALAHSIALDKRTKSEESSIYDFSLAAAQNDLYDIALNGLNYLTTRTPAVQNADEVKKQIVLIEYHQYVSQPKSQRPSPEKLLQKFENLLTELGYSARHASFILEYAHFLSFYLSKTDKAYEVLEKGIAIPDLSNMQRSLLKLELADLNVYDNDLWGATLIYAQIIDANRDNPIGDEAKLKKARLGYYLGDITWAKAQLDVLKASTSKMTANDAMELSLLITSYYDLDTIDQPIQLFARGDLLLYQNKEKEAIETFDSITTIYPGHPLTDKILMRKATLKEKDFEFEEADSLYKKLLADYPYSTSADDAMFHLATILEEKLNQKEKAQELYKQLLISYPSSIYTSDSRTRYRILRGDKPDTEENKTPNELEAAPSF